VRESYDVRDTFSQRHMLDEDFEVIPTPGHTPGATAYLWDSGEHYLLLTGDTIYLREGEWVAAVLPSSDRQRYIESLELIRDLDFDVLVRGPRPAVSPTTRSLSEPIASVVSMRSSSACGAGTTTDRQRQAPESGTIPAELPRC
jgi:glyoxylase-like metal-dependent hydrolase (beta-lactamase superfamily II)